MKHTQAAQLRATISALLAAEPGRSFSTEEVSNVLAQSARTTGQIMGGMARGGLIIALGRQGKQQHWQWPDNRESPPEDNAVVVASKRKANPAKEVELEAFGITIVVGRNERTGRLRIVLEG